MQIGAYPLNTVIQGDSRELAKSIPDNSIDLIFTDPPYPKEFMWCWEWLSMEAARILKPNGTLLAISGKMYLDQIIPAMAKHMQYHWIINIDLLKGQGGQAAQVFPRKIIENWKPVLWFQKGEYIGAWTNDHVGSSSNDKRYHKWGQSLGSNTSVLAKFSEAKIVYDPFAGGGTGLVAAKIFGIDFIGSDVLIENVNKANERLANTNPFPQWRSLTPRAADGYAASQQAQLFTAGEQPAKVSGKSRRR